MKKKLSILFLVVINWLPVQGQAYKNSIRLDTEEDIIYELCYTSHGGALALGDGELIKVFASPGYQLIKELDEGHSGTILTLDISQDSTLLTSGGTDSTIVIWDILSGEIIRKLTYHKGAVTSVRISPDAKYILSGGADGRVNLYDLTEDSLVTSILAHKYEVTTVAFHPDGKRYASAGGDGNINIYSIKNTIPDTVLMDHHDWIRKIEFNDTGDRMISCGDDKSLILWNLSGTSNIKPLKKISPSIGWLLTADFHPDNVTYILGSLNGTILLVGYYGSFETKIKKPVQCVKINPGSKSLVVIAVATRGSGVHIINARSMDKK